MLRIDLLPPRVPRTRTNKKILAVLALLAALVAVALGFQFVTLKSKVSALTDEKAKVQKQADEVAKIESETSTIRSRLQPIADRIKFIVQADECGYPFWDRFYQIAEYIYGGAELHSFEIWSTTANGLVGSGSPEDLYAGLGSPAGDFDCRFEVRVKNANEFGRFILNLIRCPEVRNVRFTGGISPGRLITADTPRLLEEWGLQGLSLPTPNPSGPGGAGGGMGMGGGMPGGGAGMGMGGAQGGMGPAGAPGGAGGAGGAPGAPGMGGPGGGGPGMAGMGGAGAAAAAVPQPRLDSDVVVTVTCQLARPIVIPQPPGAGGGMAMGGGAGGMGMGAGPGAPGAGGPPGAAGPGGPPTGGPLGAGGAAPKAGGGAAKGEEAEGGGGLGKGLGRRDRGAGGEE